MPTFEVDDQFHAHPKAAEAGDEALGLWVRAGSWCCAYLTDGRVPRGQAGRLGRDSQWASLVKSGLVVLLEDGSYQLHDFLHWNRPANTILRQRAKATEKKRDQRYHKRVESKLSPTVSPGDNAGDTHGESPVSQSHSQILSSRGSEAVLAPSAPLALSPDPIPTPKQKRLPTRKTDPTANGWKLWRSLYQAYRRRYGTYAANGACSRAMGTVVRLAHDAAVERHARAGGDVVSLEADVLDHWFRKYLDDDGHNSFLVEKRHALQYLQNAVTGYGLPWAETIDVPSARAEYVATLAQIKRMPGGES